MKGQPMHFQSSSFLLRDIPKAPDPTDHLIVQKLRARIPLKNSPVLEYQRITAGLLRMGIQINHLFHELLGVSQLLDHMIQQGLVISRLQQGWRNAPQINKPLVISFQTPFVVHDEDAIRGGFDHGREDLADADTGADGTKTATDTECDGLTCVSANTF